MVLLVLSARVDSSVTVHCEQACSRRRIRGLRVLLLACLYEHDCSWFAGSGSSSGSSSSDMLDGGLPVELV